VFYSAMSLLYALLSGEHLSLPIAELKGILESEGIAYKIINVYDQLLLFESKLNAVNRILQRAGLIKEVGLILKIMESDINVICREVKEIDWSFIDDTFKVELKRLRGHGKYIKENELIDIIAGTIIKHTRQRVNLVNPKYTVKLTLTNGLAFLGLELGKLNTKQFLLRRPDKRPYFHPGALPPHICRVFVNLSRPKHNCPYLDPFCGTGGFLIEACLMGYYSIGSDIDLRMVEGARINLKYYNLNNYEIIQADAARLPYTDTICAIGTDPPYGRSTSTKGRRLQELLEGFICTASEVLKKGSYVCFATPHTIDVEDSIKQFGMILREKHFMRVHGSLTRVIWLAYKP